MKIKTIEVGFLGTNCYILSTNNDNAIVIDPGADFDIVQNYLIENNLSLKYILLTHGHFDHMGAVKKLSENNNAKVCFHSGDADILANATLVSSMASLSQYPPVKADVYLNDGDTVSVDDINIKTMHTPGHSKGSCIFIDKKNHVIFSGDTLFKMSIGRTDLFGGAYDVIVESLKKIADIDGDYTIYPGHGEHTTLKEEKDSNPYLGTNSYDDYF